MGVGGVEGFIYRTTSVQHGESYLSLTEKHRKINHMIILMIQSVIFTSTAFEAFAKAMFFSICSICLGKKILR